MTGTDAEEGMNYREAQEKILAGINRKDPLMGDIEIKVEKLIQSASSPEEISEVKWIVEDYVDRYSASLEKVAKRAVAFHIGEDGNPDRWEVGRKHQYLKESLENVQKACELCGKQAEYDSELIGQLCIDSNLSEAEKGRDEEWYLGNAELAAENFGIEFDREREKKRVYRNVIDGEIEGAEKLTEWMCNNPNVFSLRLGCLKLGAGLFYLKERVERDDLEESYGIDEIAQGMFKKVTEACGGERKELAKNWLENAYGGDKNTLNSACLLGPIDISS